MKENATMDTGFLLPIYDLDNFNKNVDTIKEYIKKTLDDEDTTEINSIYLLELDTDYFATYGEDELEETEEDDLLDIGPWENYKYCLYLEGNSSCMGFDEGLVELTLELLYPEYKEFNQKNKEVTNNIKKMTDKKWEEHAKLRLEITVKYYVHNIEENDLLTLGGERYNTLNNIVNEEESSKGKIVKMLVAGGEFL
jgi:hypothetical protein